jgi:hypothetical protein
MPLSKRQAIAAFLLLAATAAFKILDERCTAINT